MTDENVTGMYCPFKGSCELTLQEVLHCCSVSFSSVFLSPLSLSPSALVSMNVNLQARLQGQMANRRLASLCILVFLVSVFGCVLASGHNLEIEFRDETNTISFQNTITFENNTRITDPPGTTLIHLSNGTAWEYAVPNNTTTILTAFELVNASGHYFQDVFTWSHVQTPYINCTTSCSWQIDDHGFSVADLISGRLLQFVVSWSGPYPAN